MCLFYNWLFGMYARSINVGRVTFTVEVADISRHMVTQQRQTHPV